MVTFWILLALAGLLSWFSLRHINVLLALSSSMAWLTLMGYNLNYPPTNITQGSTLHEWLTLVFVVLAITMIFWWFRTRGRTETVTRAKIEDGEVVAHSTKVDGITERNDAYRQTIRKALHPNRRRR